MKAALGEKDEERTPDNKRHKGLKEAHFRSRNTVPSDPLLSALTVPGSSFLPPLPSPLSGGPCPEQLLLHKLSLGSWNRQVGSSWAAEIA